MAIADRKPSIRSFVFLPKALGISDVEFAAYWADAAPRILGEFPAGSRLAHSIALPDPPDACPRRFDALLEFWDDGEHVPVLQRALASPDSFYERFTSTVDVAGVVAMLGTEEYIVQMGPGRLERDRTLRALWVVSRKPGMSANAFHRHWRYRHAPLVPRTPSLLRYVQYHVTTHPLEHASMAFDGVAELCWNNLMEMRESMQSAQMQEEQFTDMERFLNPQRMASGFFREIWRRGP